MVATAIRTLPLTLLRVQAALTAQQSILPLSMVQMVVPVQEIMVARIILDPEVEAIVAAVVDPLAEVQVAEATMVLEEDVAEKIVEPGDRLERDSPVALAGEAEGRRVEVIMVQVTGAAAAVEVRVTAGTSIH